MHHNVVNNWITKKMIMDAIADILWWWRWYYRKWNRIFFETIIKENFVLHQSQYNDDDDEQKKIFFRLPKNFLLKTSTRSQPRKNSNTNQSHNTNIQTANPLHRPTSVNISLYGLAAFREHTHTCRRKLTSRQVRIKSGAALAPTWWPRGSGSMRRPDPALAARRDIPRRSSAPRPPPPLALARRVFVSFGRDCGAQSVGRGEGVEGEGGCGCGVVFLVGKFVDWLCKGMGLIFLLWVSEVKGFGLLSRKRMVLKLPVREIFDLCVYEKNCRFFIFNLCL